MSEEDLIEAAPCKLRNGDWGCKTQEPVQAGDTVRIVTRANKQWRAQIEQVVWTDNQICICATASEKQKPASPTVTDQGSGRSQPQSAPSPADNNEPPAPPRPNTPPTDELDAMADAAAAQQDDFDDIMNAQNEIERDS